VSPSVLFHLIPALHLTDVDPHDLLPGQPGQGVCLIHDNVPEMIAKISSVVSSFGVNIENMINASTKGRRQAYTVLDVDSIPDTAEGAIMDIGGVIRVRILT